MIRQQCIVDTDCPDGQVCVDGECVSEGGGPQERIYEFWGQYSMPAWLVYYAQMDGIYIDGDLFQRNIPVKDGTVHIVAAPQTADLTLKTLSVGVPSYQNGQVIRIGHTFTWAPNSIATQSYDLQYNGYPYGMGLNPLGVELATTPPLTRVIWFNVRWKFIMEVG